MSKPVINAQRYASIAFPRETATSPAQSNVSNVAGLLVATNRSRRGIVVQNTNNTTIYISLGSVNPTTSAYHFALKPCAASNDGTGGIYSDDAWVGDVRAIGSAPGGTVVVIEIT